jgi:uncharacterized damage-inducible protein DinB
MPTLFDWIGPSFDFSSNFAKLLVADVPDDRMTAQPVEGRVMNHPAFLLGHLVWVNDNIIATVGGTPKFAHLKELHGIGAKPNADRSVYASKAELIAWLEQAQHALAAAVQAASPEVLAGPAPDRMRSRFPTVGTMLAALMTAHYTNHLGQLSAWRRAMGFPSVF